MQLRPGSRIGPYEIGSLLGAGGMGEVYRARDLTLHREVALKIVAGGGAESAVVLERFEREARLLASLNHPGIASIHGIADGGGVRAIVMELVEGPTLVEQLAGGALPVNDALRIAARIAEAVEAAHGKGVVHRDLKPANIKFTSGGAVKILDFGIAKAIAADAAMLEAPTREATRVGTVMGTVAYMSPEQARGLAVDTRSDIWSFGVILFEMLSGRRAFDGTTTSDVIAAVLTADPDWSALPATVPPAIVRLLQRCLERDPARRLSTIGAARYAIEELPAVIPPSAVLPPKGGSHRVAMAMAGGIAAAFVVGAASMYLVSRAMQPGQRTAASSSPAAILGMSEPPGEPLYLFAGPIALSRDGTRVALVTNSAEGRAHVWLRSLASTTPELVRGADGGMYPFWSPDGRSLGFFADGQLKIADLASGGIRSLAPWSGPVGGGTWNDDGVIVYADGGGLRRIAASGGSPTPVTSTDGGTSTLHVAPDFLPDGRHYLYCAVTPRTGRGIVMVGSIDGGEPRKLMDSTALAIYAAPGYLLYFREGEIVAQPFDARTQTLSGEPSVLAAGAWTWTSGGLVGLSASDTGVVMFATRRTAPTQLTWFDRSGRPGGRLGTPGEWVHVSLSPDERAVAAERMDPRTGQGAIWMMDVAGGAASRLTPDPSWSLAPIWSPDGRTIVYGASRDGGSDLYMKPADGVGSETPFQKSMSLKLPTDWTADGRVVFTTVTPGGTDVMVAPAAGGGQPAPIVNTSANEGSGKVSPNGRWLAYASNESGHNEVYVRALDGRGRWPISRNGGAQPRWRRDGKELFFVGDDANLMVAAVSETATSFSSAEPAALPIKVQPDVTGWRYSYDVAARGQRVIASVPVGRDQTPPIIVIPNWTSLVRK